MRWREVLIGLALLAALTAGCERQCFLSEPDYEHYRHLGFPSLECNSAASITPPDQSGPAPPTPNDPDRPIRYLSLAEALALSLEQGNIGSPALNGTSQEIVLSFTGRNLFAQENNIRVLALEPAIIGADMEASLSKFDARWVTSVAWNTTDQQIASALQTFLAAGTVNQVHTEDATLNSSLIKPLPTGGVAGITFRTDYELTNLPARLNPFYRPFLQFQFDQPLLQGFGVEINELRAAHPGLTPAMPGFNPPAGVLPFFNTGGRVEGIVITRLRFDEERAELERQVHQMLTNVEVAYWNLYGSYWNLYSVDLGLRQARLVWDITQNRVKEGSDLPQDLDLSRVQYELFRSQRLEALAQVLESERQLRSLTGLPVEDGCRLVPLDTPTEAPFQPDWGTALNDAMALRPELILARQEVKFRQLDLVNQKNQLLPDLRFTSTYDLNGAGSHLSGGGNDPLNALASLGSNQFHDWAIGLRLDVPLGFRDAHSAIRVARLRLAQSYALLKDQEKRVQTFLAAQYQQLVTAYGQIGIAKARQVAAQGLLSKRFAEYQYRRDRTLLDFLLEAQRQYTDSIRGEYTAVVNYNNALAKFEYAKGTIMEHDNVLISEGPLPTFAQKRAVEHERERSNALALRERAAPARAARQDQLDLPNVSPGSAPSLPSLMEGKDRLSTDPEEQLPAPRPLEPAGARPAAPAAMLLPPTAGSAAAHRNSEGSVKGVMPVAYRPGQHAGGPQAAPSNTADYKVPPLTTFEDGVRLAGPADRSPPALLARPTPAAVIGNAVPAGQPAATSSRPFAPLYAPASPHTGGLNGSAALGRPTAGVARPAMPVPIAETPTGPKIVAASATASDLTLNRTARPRTPELMNLLSGPSSDRWNDEQLRKAWVKPETEVAGFGPR